MKEPVKFISVWFTDGDAALYRNVETFGVYQWFFRIIQQRPNGTHPVESVIPVSRIARFKVS